jgi:hypothetical protein
LIPKHELTLQKYNDEFTVELKLWNLPIKP